METGTIIAIIVAIAILIAIILVVKYYNIGVGVDTDTKDSILSNISDTLHDTAETIAPDEE
jgi:hypothetical protein